jgi:hypothetical protein
MAAVSPAGRGELFVKSGLCGGAGGNGFFNGEEPAEENLFTGMGDPSFISMIVGLPTDTANAESVISVDGRIGAILGLRREPEVSNPVIGAVSVDMIDLIRRPLCMHVEPSQPMQLIGPALDLRADVALKVSEADSSIFTPRVLVFAPAHDPGVGVI